MSQAHVNAFLIDAKIACNQQFREKTSSLKPLVAWLRDNMANPQPTTENALYQLAKEDRRRDKYRPTMRRLAAVWGTNATYPTALQELAFGRAYHRALYWHGVKSPGVVNSILQNGLQTRYGACNVGATNPGYQALPNGGPISIGLYRDISEPYSCGANGLLRLFPPAARGKNGIQAGADRFVKGELRLLRDRDNPSTVLLQEDLSGDHILQGQHTLVTLAQPNSARTRTILESIAGYDDALPQSVANLIPLLRIALQTGAVGDGPTHEPVVAKPQGYWI